MATVRRLSAQRAQARAMAAGGAYVERRDDGGYEATRKPVGDRAVYVSTSGGVLRSQAMRRQRVRRLASVRAQRRGGLGFLNWDDIASSLNTLAKTTIEQTASAAIGSTVNKYLGVDTSSGTSYANAPAPQVVYVPQESSSQCFDFKKYAPWIAAGGAGLLALMLLRK